MTVKPMTYEEWRDTPKRVVVRCTTRYCHVTHENGTTTYIDGRWESAEEAERATYEWLNAEPLPPVPDDVKQRLHALGDERRRQECSLRDIAPALGVSVSTLSNWERGIVAPSDDVLAAWEAVLAQGKEPSVIDEPQAVGFALILNVDQRPIRGTEIVMPYITDGFIPRPFLRDVAGSLGLGPAEWIDDADAARLLKAIGGPIGPRECDAYERIVGNGSR